ncbi:MAG: phosphoglycerate dehydrogenase [Deltaproteobacteria bacterium]|nr:phosphoglycerate dehydrogenase [Deltaproteobacteria bacterium]
MKRVLVSDNMSELGIEVFRKADGIEVDVKTGLSPEELKAIIKDYHGLAVRSATKATKEIIEAADNLQVIGRAGSGTDNIDKEAATKRGIVVMNTPGGNTVTTGEHTIAMLMSLLRNIPQANASMKAKKWEKKKFEGTEMYQKTLGLVGMGKIGSVVAERARGLQMNVVVYDPFVSAVVAERLGAEIVSLDELFARADFITVHTPKNKETENLINKDAFAKMKDGVRIINCARGGIVNESDLCDAIKSGKVAGAALDVFSEEPPPADLPLLELDRVICTPHLGASTEEAQVNVAVAVAEQMVDYLLNGTIRNAVNVPSISGELLAELSPYLTLAERMGSFQSQLITGTLEEVNIEYSGGLVDYDLKPLTIFLMKGLLKNIDEDVNFVNALNIAHGRGIKVVDAKTNEASEFTDLITLKTKTTEGEFVVAGTVFGKRDPRVVRINDFRLESVLEQNMLLFHTHDEPGVIGNIGTTLGENNVNISRMQFGRKEKSGEALVILGVDGQYPEKVFQSLVKLPNILSAKQIHIEG